MEGLRNIRIVAAVVEIDGEVMLVRQQGPTDTEPTWTLPGGRVEPGETLIEALGRELLEETGLTLDAASPTLLYISEMIDVEDAMHAVTFVFHTRVLSDTAPIADSDGFVLEARFVPHADAIERLARHSYFPMAEPPVAYLRGENTTFWSYRVSPLGIIERILPIQ
jgi:8-oxo-dGTP diphosphatase